MLTDGVNHNYTVKVHYKKRDRLLVPRGELLQGEFIVSSEVRLHTEQSLKELLRLCYPVYEFWYVNSWEEEEVVMPMETIDHLTEVNTIARRKKCFMVVKMYLKTTDAYRDEHGRPQSWAPKEFTPASMKRLVFQVDGFTSIDFEELDTGQLRVLCNSFRLPEAVVGKGYPEDVAFHDDKWANDSVVTWPDLKAAIRRYCEISAERFKNL